MRKFAVAAALATTALAGPALAHDHAWYIGVEAGATLKENMKFDIRNTAGVVTQDALKVRTEIGYDAGGLIGYDFGGFRMEAESFYQDNNLDSINVPTSTPPIAQINGAVLPTAAGNYPNADGNVRILAFMANGLFDFGGKGRDLGGYIGGGAGVARVKLSNLQLAKFGNKFMDDSDTSFAWQVLAGIYKPITKHVDLGLKYRFLNVQSVDTYTTNGLKSSSQVHSHSLLLTLAYNFYTEAAPPPPPAPVMAPPPPPAPLPPCPPAAVTPGPFLVFFDWDKSVIKPEAKQILDRAVEQYKATGQTSVALGGYTDTSGTADYNVRLGQRRADAVKAYMSAAGVPDGVITSESFGETKLLVQTADGVREAQNRRVEITFGGAPAPTSSGPCTPQ